MQPVVDAGNSVLAARSVWRTAAQSDRAMQAQSKTFLSAVKQAIYVLFGNNPDALADFGLLPKKVRVPLTPAARVVAAAKSAATRKARGTTGKKVHGTVADTIGVSTTGGTGGKPGIIPPAPNAVPANPPAAGGGGGGAAQGNGGGAVPAANGGTGTHG